MRLFVGVTPEAAALRHLDDALAAVRDRPGAPRWTAPELWHLTLAFLGEVEERRLPALREHLAGVRAAPIRAELAGAGRFPPRGAPKVLWIGVAAPGLADLAAGVAAAARRARIPVERRPFRAHLTVGRWRPGDTPDPGFAAELGGYRGPAFELSRFVLLRSHLGPAPRHEPLEAWPLAGG